MTRIQPDPDRSAITAALATLARASWGFENGDLGDQCRAQVADATAALGRLYVRLSAERGEVATLLHELLQTRLDRDEARDAATRQAQIAEARRAAIDGILHHALNHGEES